MKTSVMTKEDELLRAIRCNDIGIEKIKSLLNKGMNPSIQIQEGRYSGWTFLHVAVEFGCVGILQELFKAKESHPNIQDKWGETLLHLAIRNRNFHILDFLLSLEEINLNIEDIWGIRPIDIASTFQDHDIVEKLLKSGANE